MGACCHHHMDTSFITKDEARFLNPERPYGTESPVERHQSCTAVQAVAGRRGLVKFAQQYTVLYGRSSSKAAAQTFAVTWSVMEVGPCHRFEAELHCKGMLDRLQLCIPDPFPRSTVRNLVWRRRGHAVRVQWDLHVEPGETMRPLPNVLGQAPPTRR
jgi:hypothetical protein